MGTVIAGRLVRLGKEIYNLPSISFTNYHQFTSSICESLKKPGEVTLDGPGWETFPKPSAD